MGLDREHSFTVRHKKADGEEVESEFVCQLPSLKQRRQIGLLEARLRNGVPVSDLDDLTLSLIQQSAYLSVTITSKPDYVDFDEELDAFLTTKVFAEVMMHEGRFLEDRDIKEGDGSVDGG
tara:strand:+ start:299 stop:661 length:363 start_codon:yes stop_codon:yes gene_type:complete